jgi:hypothetical protein
VLFEETQRNFQQSAVWTYRASPKSCPLFTCNLYEVVSAEDVAAKLEALRHYPMYGKRGYFRPENVEAQLRVNAIPIGEEYAEAFRVVKQIHWQGERAAPSPGNAFPPAVATGRQAA